METASKQCVACGEVKQVAEFPNKTGASDGLQIRCRPCHKAFVANWRRTKADRERATEKRCPRCEVTKPGSDFSRSRKSSDGCAVYCKPCMAEWNRERNPVVAGSKIVTEKRCPRCDEVKPASGFFRNSHTRDGLYGYCKPCWTAYNNENADPDKRAASLRRAHLRRTYNLTPEDYDAMLAAQGGGCAICKGQCATGKRLAVDHCHKEGTVRGLLCKRCNSVIGYVQDDLGLLRAAIDYLTFT